MINKQSGISSIWVILILLAVILLAFLFTPLNKLIGLSSDVPGSNQSLYQNQKQQSDIVAKKNRDAKRLTDITRLRTAVEIYFDHNGSYPTALSQLSPSSELPSIPKDPLDGSSYGYFFKPQNKPTFYHLWTFLELQNGNMGSDSDFDSSSEGGINGKIETCTTQHDCIYDLTSI